MSESLPSTEAFDAFVVVPTIADGDHILPTVRRLIVHNSGMRILLMLSINPVDMERAKYLIGEIEQVVPPENVRIAFHWEDGPIGFGAANNRGLMECIRIAGGMAPFVVFHNDDAFVPSGWLPKIAAAFKTQKVCVWGEPWDEESGKARNQRPVEGYGQIGIVGPLSNNAAGIQQFLPPKSMDPDQAGEWAAQNWAGQVITADFISGFCMALSAEAVARLMLFRPEGDGPLVERNHPESDEPVWPDWEWSEAIAVGVFDEDNFPIAGYEDNDLCVRADLAGIRCAVAPACYVSHLGHQSFDKHWPGMERGMRNRLAFYRKYASMTQRDQRLVAVFRLGFEVPNDINFFKMAAARAAQVCDGIAVLLTRNPLDVRNTEAWLQEGERLRLEDTAMLKSCSGEEREGVAEAVHGWLTSILTEQVKGSRVEAADIRIECWDGEFNERDERNRAIAMAYEMEADWVISIDGDECIEDRITREHIDRYMRHPDPLVRSYDFAWLNHWNYTDQVRVDYPWGDDGTYVGGMHGFRLFRVTDRATPTQILAGTANGLHCGNTPDHDPMAKRVAALRMRHYGYLRPTDRQRKHARYLLQDPNPDWTLVGGDSYGHIIDDENLKASPYVRINGIGVHFLCHPGESASDVGRWLDQLYSLADRVVCVWTDEWDEDDQAWLEPYTDEQTEALASWDAAVAADRELCEQGEASWDDFHAALKRNPRPVFGRRAAVGVGAFSPDWPSDTGPSADVAEMGAAFGIEWVHQPLNDHIAEARNAGLNALQPGYEQGVGWSLFFDPDEWYEDDYTALVAIRRMAEVSNLHGWLVEAVNYHEDHPPSMSESIRMARLLPQMRMNGRVHEGFAEAIESMREVGVNARFRMAPVRIQHRGLAKDEEAMTDKLQRYQGLLLLELEDNPHNSNAWTSLGLQLMNDGQEEQAVECWERAVACADGGFLAFRELAYFHLRKASAFHRGAIDRATASHPWVRQGGAESFQRGMAKYIPDFPILGSARRGVPTCSPIELPDFTAPVSVREVASGERGLVDASPVELNDEDLEPPPPIVVEAETATATPSS